MEEEKEKAERKKRTEEEEKKIAKKEKMAKKQGRAGAISREAGHRRRRCMARLKNQPRQDWGLHIASQSQFKSC